MTKTKQENSQSQVEANVGVMTYSELKTALKPLKAQGITQIKLNAPKALLEEEYNRLMSLTQPPTIKAEMETPPPTTELEEKLDDRTFREQLIEKMGKEQNNPDPTPEEKRKFWANIDRVCKQRKQQKLATEPKQDSSEAKQKAKQKAEKEAKLKEEKEASRLGKEKAKKNPPKRYKILAGNGCHQAIAEVQGMLVQSTADKGKFSLILPDGLHIEAFFKTPHLHWLACNTEAIQGLHWWRGYPKMSDNKLVCLQIIAWDVNMTDNKYEKWEFTGVWTAQRNITVQRTMSDKDIRKIAKETGFIKKFKYTFTNSFDFKRNLWVGYVYKILANRKGDSFEIRKVIPYACPRIKPKPPERKPPAKRR